MGRRPGFQVSQETRDKIRNGVRRAQAEGRAVRPTWPEVSSQILSAATDGDYEQAEELLREYIELRHTERMFTALADDTEMSKLVAKSGIRAKRGAHTGMMIFRAQETQEEE